MQVIYKPKRDSNYNLVPGQEVAYAALLPDGYPALGKKYGWVLMCHGISERSGGTLEHLKNLVEGVDYNKDGTIDGSFVKNFHKEAVDKYQLIFIIVTYSDFFDTECNWVYNDVLKNYSVVPKMLFDGFSLGGGAVYAFAKSSVANANKIAVAVPCAPTNQGGSTAAIAQAGLPMHFFVNDEDDNPSTDINVTKKIIADINAANPPIKARFTAFRQKYHGGFDKATDIVAPAAPGGQGVIDLSENIYEWYLDVLKNGPRQMKSGTVALPLPEPEPPATTLEARVSYTIEGGKIHLVGDKSIGYKSGSEGRWEFVSAPEGVTKYQVFPGGSTYINADGVLPKPGTYVFRFQLKDLSPLEVVVKFGDGPVVPIGFDSTTDLITYSDGTTEKGTAVFSGGKWVVKTASGQIINL